MTKIAMEIKNCSQCPNCYDERFYTSDSFEHESNYYCKLFPNYDKHPKTDHQVKELVQLRGKPGVIDLFVEWRLEVPVPDWCPLKVKE